MAPGGALDALGRRHPIAAAVLLPVYTMLAVPLETRFPPPALPDRIDGIITLGGALGSRGLERWGQPQMNEHGERVTEAIALSRRYPDALLVVSGGHWNPKARYGEAEIARRVLADLGHRPEHVIYENESRTTWENAVLSQGLVKPKPGQTWVLVTSALHMPRAVGVFRRLGWEVIPYPVDYITDGTVRFGLESAGYRLDRTDFTVREWLALASYYLQGRTSELLPR